MSLLIKEYIVAAQVALGGAELMPDYAERDVACLGMAIYHEARSESKRGKVAVGHVVMNRSAHPMFASEICDVITEGGEDRATGCQFSWWCDGKSDHPTEAKAWRESLDAAVEVLAGNTKDPTAGAVFFFLVDMPTPSWAKGMTRTAVIEQHRFYR